MTDRSSRFLQWAREYGGLFSLKVGPGTVIVITSPDYVKRLLDKRSNIYSNRPVSYVGDGIIASGDHVLMMQYSDKWRLSRKLTHQFFMEKMVIERHTQVVDAEAVQMAYDLIRDPDHHMDHPKRYSNSIIMSLMYGIRTPDIHTAHLQNLYDLLHDWTRVMEMGATPPVDIFPFLKYIPERFLGMWRSRAQNVSNKMNKLYNDWYQLVLDRRRDVGARDSFADRIIDQEAKIGWDRHALDFLCGVLVEGGSDTTSTAITAFLHAMTKYPAVVAKAQAEVDSIVDEDRTPTWEDYDRLPYIAACVKETMRWRPAAPMGFPHTLSQDDEIDGMFLPKGSDVIINVLGMQHDPERFPNPDDFDPDHYKGVTALAPELANGDAEKRDHYVYGAGRRVCAGMHLAERSLFLGIAKMLWALDVRPGVDADGHVIPPNTDLETAYTHGLLTCAKPFPCRISARSERRRETLRREFERASVDVFSRFDTAGDKSK